VFTFANSIKVYFHNFVKHCSNLPHIYVKIITKPCPNHGKIGTKKLIPYRQVTTDGQIQEARKSAHYRMLDCGPGYAAFVSPSSCFINVSFKSIPINNSYWTEGDDLYGL
jgi:hypothetical protein